MPYLQVEVDVIEVWASRLAEAAQISEDQAIGGLTRLWHLAWKRKVDRLSSLAIESCFRGAKAAQLLPALVEFEFVRRDNDAWLIRGADRRLGLLERRRAAAAKTNAHRWGTDEPPIGSAIGPPINSVGPPIGPPIGQASVLHPDAQTPRRPDAQLSAIAEKTGDSRVIDRGESAGLKLAATPPTKPPKKPKQTSLEIVDPTWQPLIARLTASFTRLKGTAPGWEGLDFKRLKELRGRGSDDEIVTRWERGLVGTYKREVNSVSELWKSEKWNALATADARGVEPVSAEWNDGKNFQEALKGELQKRGVR